MASSLSDDASYKVLSERLYLMSAQNIYASTKCTLSSSSLRFLCKVRADSFANLTRGICKCGIDLGDSLSIHTRLVIHVRDRREAGSFEPYCLHCQTESLALAGNVDTLEVPLS